MDEHHTDRQGGHVRVPGQSGPSINHVSSEDVSCGVHKRNAFYANVY